MSTGNQAFNASGSANLSGLFGSINGRKYQQLPARHGIELVPRRPFIPVSGSVTFTQSIFASGDSPVPDGLISVITGSSSGKSSLGTALMEPSSQCMIGIGSPQ